MIILIDNYDSFVYTIGSYLCELGATVEIHRNDALSISDVLRQRPEGIVLSPGPCAPGQAGLCLDLIPAVATRIPLLGVCLGHQAIGQAFGAGIRKAPVPMHGKTSLIHHRGEGLFRKIPSPFRAMRYHSLIVERESVPDMLEVTAWSEESLVMGLQHRVFPIYGVQFHPESVASEYGYVLLGSFLSVCRGFQGRKG